MNTPLDLGQQIASDAMNDIGHAYALGGAPGTDFSQPWDCSSAVNKWLGHDFGMRLPGQSKAGYDGTSHGPGSWQYITWSGAKTVGGPPQAGDLLIWPGMGVMGHIGIAISSTDMVSALNPRLGTARTPIVSTKPGIHIIRRVDGSAINANPGCPIPGLMIALAEWEFISAIYSMGRNQPSRTPRSSRKSPKH
jgi:NlpC/P60 family